MQEFVYFIQKKEHKMMCECVRVSREGIYKDTNAEMKQIILLFRNVAEVRLEYVF